jgi:deoxyribodipyrimidine photo-lyase
LTSVASRLGKWKIFHPLANLHRSSLMHRLVIHWFRRDLRLTDNTALNLAAAKGEKVLPVYLLSRELHRWTGSNRQHFLCQSLASLAANLEAIGTKLLVRQGDAVEEILRLVAETGATAVSFNRDVDPFGQAQETKLKIRLTELGVEVLDALDHAMFGPDSVRTGSGDPYRVFTPYSRAWRKLPPLPTGPTVRTLPVPDQFPQGEKLPTLDHWGLPPAGPDVLTGGERAARERLKSFLAGPVALYGDQRDRPAIAGTSRISQDLRFGLLSIREIFARLEKALATSPASTRAQLEKYATELIWREFYFQILSHYPEVLETEFNPTFRGMNWPGSQDHLTHWQEGTTGFPIVDAGMRELRATGFMHNRVRMITAMFLTKDLQLDWRLGESWFLQHLADGEIASNNGGWQWSAGTGADAAPYFRIQNPWSQTKRYDPAGLYIKKWVPELRAVPAAQLAEPPSSALAPGYPSPIVDHARQRESTLELFKKHRSS